MRIAKKSEEYYARTGVDEFAPRTGKRAKVLGSDGKPKKKAASMWDRRTAAEELSEFIRTREWDAAAPKHFVELYRKLHEDVYGIEALELRPKAANLAAAALARKAMKEFFAGDPNALADFLRWCWIRAANEEKARREGRKANDFRISWRYQFSARLVSDYRRAVLTEKR